MPKKRAKVEAKDSIISAALELIKRRGADGVTVEGVAKAAGCAKGLVHYHFKTKRGLLEAVAQSLAGVREVNWAKAFRAPTPKDAIDRSWMLLTTESGDGSIRAWTSLFGSSSILPDQTVRASLTGFSLALGKAVDRMFRDLGLQPRVPPSEIGWLLGAVVNGMGLQILGGADRHELEGAYAAAWLGILSLATPPAYR
ncbi:MAG: TetR family transcriptional regulator [Gemmatimonadales bacterium]|nr:TetR family transcriptional regulator [Gemmatimonadales bacterium]NIN10370.1 TetR family transcriptional regulator [Gemmatimonadales bacterium]NIN49162.1 TetR family transcriptional regulator [Gemmatimonadales bacterium]NIP06626.1 TetR family transcriptional regulator [Gemmatimonadales bacterium]NIQ99956.1 TetR family transcriptional regulator [Gemmatimonadales bacterium]